MTIREEIEAREARELSPHACLSTSSKGREREEEIIVSTHMGMGAHDVCCAEIVYRRALERGMGQMLRLT